MDTTIIQIPVTKSVRDNLAVAVQNLGFSSIQDAIRLFFNQLLSQSITVKFESKPITLSSKSARRYAKIDRDIEKGINITRANSIDELMLQLNTK